MAEPPEFARGILDKTLLTTQDVLSLLDEYNRRFSPVIVFLREGFEGLKTYVFPIMSQVPEDAFRQILPELLSDIIVRMRLLEGLRGYMLIVRRSDDVADVFVKIYDRFRARAFSATYTARRRDSEWTLEKSAKWDHVWLNRALELALSTAQQELEPEGYT